MDTGRRAAATSSGHTQCSPLCLTLPHAVGEFRRLALLAEADGHLRQKLQQVGGRVGLLLAGYPWVELPGMAACCERCPASCICKLQTQLAICFGGPCSDSSVSKLPNRFAPLTQPNPTLQVLKLSKEKWDEARDHAMRAVVADNRMRIWCVCRGQGRQARVRLLLLPDLLMQYAHTHALHFPAAAVNSPTLSTLSHLPLPPGTPTSPTWMWACCSRAAWETWTWTGPWVRQGRAAPIHLFCLESPEWLQGVYIVTKTWTWTGPCGSADLWWRWRTGGALLAEFGVAWHILMWSVLRPAKSSMPAFVHVVFVDPPVTAPTREQAC